MHAYVVEAEEVRKRFGEREVVCGVSFRIPAGICFGLLGPNGAGKTTLMRMLTGMSPLGSGRYLAFGEPVGAAAMRARIGIVPQHDNLDPDFTVRENLLVYAGFFGIDRNTAGKRADELLAFAELTGREKEKVSGLSGGMRRRLMIARALINDPELVVLDEPTTGLDPQARHVIWERLRRLKRQGKTLLLTTHYMDEAEQLCDDIVVIDHGKLLAQGSPRQLIREHVEPEVVALAGSIPDADIRELAGKEGMHIEQVGDMWYCYTDHAAPLLAKCAEHSDARFIHRPANLEDVFLRLTGREMRD
jgi:lipooligosaccharide transport system ATP-binding protein